MTRTAEAARATSDALASQLDALIQSAGELLENLNEQRGEATETLRTRASRNIDSARRRLADMKDYMPDNATQAARAAAGFARENPWTTIAAGSLIAASIAALIYLGSSDRR